MHDTTDMVFAGETAARGAGALGAQAARAFGCMRRWPCRPMGCGRPLGLLSLLPFVREVARRRGRRRPTRRCGSRIPTKESRCWGDGVAAVRARFGGPVARRSM